MSVVALVIAPSIAIKSDLENARLSAPELMKEIKVSEQMEGKIQAKSQTKQEDVMSWM